MARPYGQPTAHDGIDSAEVVLKSAALRSENLSRVLRMTTGSNRTIDVTLPQKEDSGKTQFELIQSCLKEEKEMHRIKRSTVLSRSKLLLRLTVWWYVLTPLWVTFLITYLETGALYIDSPNFGPLMSTFFIALPSMGTAVALTAWIVSYLEDQHGLLIHGTIWKR